MKVLQPDWMLLMNGMQFFNGFAIIFTIMAVKWIH